MCREQGESESDGDTGEKRHGYVGEMVATGAALVGCLISIFTPPSEEERERQREEEENRRNLNSPD